MKLNMNTLTNEEKYLLIDLSYLNLSTCNGDECCLNEIIQITVDKTSDDLENLERAQRIQKTLKKYPKLGKLKVVAYRNNNGFDPYSNTGNVTKTGFVGYVLEDDYGNRAILFRGTEFGFDKKFAQDMVDNIAASLAGNSPQVSEAKAFFDRYKVKEKTNLLLGHSKGGNETTEVYVDNLDLDIKAYVVNAQPIKITDLSVKQVQALKGDNYTFTIHEGDYVSPIGVAPFVDNIIQGVEGDPHTCVGVKFNEDGSFASVDAEGPSKMRDLSGQFWWAFLTEVDTVGAIESTIVNTCLAVNDTINTTKASLQQSINACHDDIEAIDKAITMGFDNLLYDIEGILVELSFALAEDLALIAEGFTEVLNANPNQDLAEKIKLVSGVTKVGVGMKELIFDPIEAREAILGLVLEEVQRALKNMAAELKDWVKNSARLVTTTAKACGDLISSLFRGRSTARYYKTFGASAVGTDQRVMVDRLRDLGKQLRRLNESYEQHVYESVQAVSRLLSQINAEYGEAYVRNASAEVRREMEQLEQLYQSLRAEMYKKEQALKTAADSYEITEAKVTRDIVFN